MVWQKENSPFKETTNSSSITGEKAESSTADNFKTVLCLFLTLGQTFQMRKSDYCHDVVRWAECHDVELGATHR